MPHLPLPTLFIATLPLPKYGPVLIVGCIIAAYWWRVLRMAYKMRRQTGRAANFVPTEPLGRVLRIIWQPVVWIWIAHPLASAFLARPKSFVRPIFSIVPLQWFAVMIAIAAYIATRICWKRMGKSWRMGIDPNERTPLVLSGPYAYVRNPIYALSSLLMICTVVIVPSPLMIVAGILHLLLLQWEVRREERHLLHVHGDLYRQYLENVGRFLPKTLHRYAPLPAAT